MSKNNFKRSNVDVETLQVSAPKSSSFDLTKNDVLSIPFGKLYPVRVKKLMAGSLFSGSVNSNLNLENFTTPMAGRMRLDQHVFVVSARRIFNDWRQWFEKGIQNSDSLPAVNLYQNMQTYLANFDNLADYFDVSEEYDHINEYFAHVLEKVAQDCYSNSINTSLASTHGNHLDYWYEEYERLIEIAKRVKESTSFYGMVNLFYDIFARILCEGSTLDQLGYDIYAYYSDWTDLAREKEEYAFKIWQNAVDEEGNPIPALNLWRAYVDNVGSSLDFATLARLPFVTNFVGNSTPTSPTWEFEFTSAEDLNKEFPLQCEDALRANYAVWYDEFRNWHIEGTDSCLNPDNFSTQETLIYSETLSVPNYKIYSQLQLLVPRCRNWSRDMFTMIQPDDYYRHVQAPATTDPFGSQANSTPDGSQLFDDFLTTKVGLFNKEHDDFAFPLGTSFFYNSYTRDTFYHDLITMRRANMLENYLRRNYYNPDTYVGQMEARYGIKPADFSLLTAQYLGGSEQMIEGSQLQANLGSESTPVGTRTFTANAGSTGSFSYSICDPSYLLTYVSIMPLPHYNAKNSHLAELKVHDQVIPEFADDTRIGVQACDFVRGINNAEPTLLGFVPRYYQYRHELDGVHGAFLREYRPYTWLRDAYSVGQDSMTTKNPVNERVHVSLDCFAGKKSWDYVARGSVTTSLFVQCALPGKLEFV